MDKSQFYKEIKLQIMENKLKGGQPLIESEYSKKFKISRTPVREVFRKLESDNLVKIIPNKGTYVRGLTLSDVAEILDIRIVLEGFAALKAAQKINANDIKKLNNIKLMISKATESNEDDIFYRANKELHDLILERYGNRRVINILDSLKNEIHWFITITKKISGRKKNSTIEHHKIISALLAGDARQAKEFMIEHLQNTKEVLIESGYFL